MDAYLSKMLRAVEAENPPSEQSELLRRCGKDLLARPDMCAGLLHESKTELLSDGYPMRTVSAKDAPSLKTCVMWWPCSTPN